MIEFDEAGDGRTDSWGNAELLDPSICTAAVLRLGHDDNVWIASAPSGMVTEVHARRQPAVLLSRSARRASPTPVRRHGQRGGRSTRTRPVFLMPSSISVDPAERRGIYVSDGGRRAVNGNRRIAVMDGAGASVRQWQPEGHADECTACRSRRTASCTAAPARGRGFRVSRQELRSLHQATSTIAVEALRCAS